MPFAARLLTVALTWKKLTLAEIACGAVLHP
jgi:hypothetical protein